MNYRNLNKCLMFSLEFSFQHYEFERCLKFYLARGKKTHSCGPIYSSVTYPVPKEQYSYLTLLFAPHYLFARSFKTFPFLHSQSLKTYMDIPLILQQLFWLLLEVSSLDSYQCNLSFYVGVNLLILPVFIFSFVHICHVH